MNWNLQVWSYVFNSQLSDFQIANRPLSEKRMTICVFSVYLNNLRISFLSLRRYC